MLKTIWRHRANFGRVVTFARRYGLAAAWRRAVREFKVDHARRHPSARPFLPPLVGRYDAWLRVNRPTDWARVRLQEALAARQGRLPVVSVVMPVYNTAPALLDRAIATVHDQVYGGWELCIADDASTDDRVWPVIQDWCRRDHRIKAVRCDVNGGISRATNCAAALATGEFIAFLDHDDELTADALAEVALLAADCPALDLIYSDDDKIDPAGRRHAPQFKPDWAPVLLLSYMYMSHLLVVRRSLFERIGGFRTGFEGSQDYDFVLRASEHTDRIGHIPRVLYHWRAVPGSTATAGDAKSGSLDAGLRAVSEAFARRGSTAVVEHPDWAKAARIGVFSPRFPHTGPRVAIIIPTRNRVDLLSACIRSLEQTLYRNHEVVVIDNDSDDPKTLTYLAGLPHRVIRIGNPDGRFSFARLMNQAAAQVDAEFLLFLNNDTEVRTPHWLGQMVGYALMDGVGAVGARLLFPNHHIQHAGIVHGYYNGLAGPAFKNLPQGSHGYLGYTMVAREYSAVTAACLLTPRALFFDIGGFDEADFAVTYNDVDYCYRLVDRGYRCIYCPSAELLHNEGSSRASIDNPKEVAAMRAKYARRRDPYYNPNLSLASQDFEIQPYRRPLPGDRPVRTLMISHNLNHEGAPNSQLELTLGLIERGVIDPIVMTPADGPLRQAYAQAGVEVIVTAPPHAGSPSLAVFDQRLDELGRFIQAQGVEVVYANTLQSFWAIAAAARAAVPALWNVRESEGWETYFDFLGPDLKARALGCFATPYRVIFVAEATRLVWAPLESRYNFAVIPNGLDLNRLEARAEAWTRDGVRAELGLAPGELAVVLLGTVCRRKGQLDLVQALPRLPAELVKNRLRFFIVGDRPGEYSTALHAAAAALPAALQSRLAILPETDRALLYFRAADIALFCSRIESYPRVILEAMALGLPVVTTPVYGVREQVQDGINGLFYPYGNPAALARTLLRLAEDEALRSRLAGNSRPVFDCLTSYPEMLDRYGALFREAGLSHGGPVEAPGTRPAAG